MSDNAEAKGRDEAAAAPALAPAVGEPGYQLPVEGLVNLRDLGGWTTPNGVVRRGRLFRSERLDELTPASHQALDDLGISTVIDLRFDSEIEEAPSRLWSTVTNHVEVSMEPENRREGSFMDRVLAGEFDNLSNEWIANMYEQLMDRHRAKFVEAITSAVSGGPALFHCSAGKDRTGIMAMLILQVLGVSDEDIITDFDLTNLYRTEQRIAAMTETMAQAGLEVEDFRPIMSAPVPAMRHALEWVASQGGAKAYLVDAGFEPLLITRMRDELVE